MSLVPGKRRPTQQSKSPIAGDRGCPGRSGACASARSWPSVGADAARDCAPAASPDHFTAPTSKTERFGGLQRQTLHARPSRPREGRGRTCSVTSWSERSGAIMTPSPCWQAPRSAGMDAAARLILRDPDRAEDAVQETLVRCWRDLPTLRDPDRFEAWLNRLFLNACRDQLRSAKRRSIEVVLPEIHPLSGAGRPVGLGRPGRDRAWREPPRARPPDAHRHALLPGPAAPRRGRSHRDPGGDRQVAAPSGDPGAARRARLGCAQPAPS